MIEKTRTFDDAHWLDEELLAACEEQLLVLADARDHCVKERVVEHSAPEQHTLQKNDFLLQDTHRENRMRYINARTSFPDDSI